MANDPSSGGGVPAGYDEVGILNGDGSLIRMSRQQFEGLPLPDRVRLLMGGKGKLQFFRGGQSVTARDALRG
jgi:hypothetical protein